MLLDSNSRLFDRMENINKKYTNQLINQTSPYLQQHAHNPVDWYPWGKNALKKALTENKLIIISIGYSACHWCHVMEHESFEDEQVARIMNENFVSIKVDREERPDIDAVYMDAIQYISGRGGWPLNCIALPDGQPVYGGTYFRKEEWMNLLIQLAEMYKVNKAKLLDYAEQLRSGLLEDTYVPSTDNGISGLDLKHAVTKWKASFDKTWGGGNGAPKFPMPNGLEFLLQSNYFNEDKELLDHVELTLDKLAAGGIYDQLGGGFSRYSVDAEWKVPHFEKMLYDNAQLISLYSLAFRIFKNEKYKKIVYQTLEFLEREMHAPSGGYYAALDADSEGVEGKYYCWSSDEIDRLLDEKSTVFKSFYTISKNGNWEHGNNIIYQTAGLREFASKSDINPEELEILLNESKNILLKARLKRIHPSTDTKVLCSWNALCLTALVESYRTFGENFMLEKSKTLANFLADKYTEPTGKVYRMQKNDKSMVPGFLDDYALLAGALIDLYTVTFNEKWLKKSVEIVDYTIQNFFDEKSGLFFYSSRNEEKLFKTKNDVTDNVIPSSNSILANVLMRLSVYFDNENYREYAKNMLLAVIDKLNAYPAYFSNWGQLFLKLTESIPEVVFTGENALTLLEEFNTNFHPAYIAGSIIPSEIPLLSGRVKKEKNLIYVCRNKICQLPTGNVDEALLLLQQ